MGEIGIIASVIQVADVSFRLSSELYRYVDSLSSADKRIDDIINIVRFTAATVKEVSLIFNDDETFVYVSRETVAEAQKALQECKDIFEELKKQLKKSRWGKFRFPFREQTIHLLLAGMEYRTSNFKLLLQVLQFAQVRAASLIDHKTKMFYQARIEELVEAREEERRKYEKEKRKYRDLINKDYLVAPNKPGASGPSGTKGVDITSAMTASNLATTPIATSSGTGPSIGSRPLTVTESQIDHCLSLLQTVMDALEEFREIIRLPAQDSTPAPSTRMVEHYIKTRNALDAVLVPRIEHSERPGLHDEHIRGKKSERLLESGEMADKSKWDDRSASDGHLRTHSLSKPPRLGTSIPSICILTAYGPFHIPWHRFQTWKGMRREIEQEIGRYREISSFILQRHYNLVDPNGEVIDPHCWRESAHPGLTLRLELTPPSHVSQSSPDLTLGPEARTRETQEKARLQELRRREEEELAKSRPHKVWKEEEHQMSGDREETETLETPEIVRLLLNDSLQEQEPRTRARGSTSDTLDSLLQKWTTLNISET
ncbi:hypothetical protein BDY21DRAFT_141448 [Lineolata rhizophorae]|uniref:Ubiquitin-like domain-containing protein n=1 Tax=Lineolata rhizophorae TaxID=578093 RepID=A0A6A6NP95_9PEZI|nr:hypothetical protein BDY21DRAFT_141448 [Lineolata rhizophorae]